MTITKVSENWKVLVGPCSRHEATRTVMEELERAHPNRDIISTSIGHKPDKNDKWTVYITVSIPKNK